MKVCVCVEGEGGWSAKQKWLVGVQRSVYVCVEESSSQWGFVRNDDV